jgi:hypothetical protein
MFDMKCGCGRETRYQVLDSDGKETYACNKHVRCLDYGGLKLLAELQRRDIVRLKSAAEDILGTEKVLLNTRWLNITLRILHHLKLMKIKLDIQSRIYIINHSDNAKQRRK